MLTMLIDPLGPDFAYVQVADDLARRIRAGAFAGNLPGERALAEEYEVAYMTVRHAMAVLRDRGVL
jgi:DNA-binding GntR family transcriptional regulator